ncbi:hypothetical protein CCACVL1_14934 [Corchorus capsularis]|uniref:HMA domain-containing protein n=1 Tax=Corchorus capsularis TaxID=210143 RepID=A0A1R3I4V5_COCAP|nr:hypothetical protein CCACVL1_14934 [Corchorus capsularis]
MALSSWARRVARRRAPKCRYTRQLLSSLTTSFSSKPLDVVLAANLGCSHCQKRVSDAISRIDAAVPSMMHKSFSPSTTKPRSNTIPHLLFHNRHMGIANTILQSDP